MYKLAYFHLLRPYGKKYTETKKLDIPESFAEKFRYYNLNGPQKIVFDNFKLHKNDDNKFLMTKDELNYYLDGLDILDEDEEILG